ncbi:MAG: DUF2917 domain-containing protein [Ramlibacter sp.]|nr:DUF2917 domain-containing protein [Ramlibacter sp.]
MTANFDQAYVELDSAVFLRIVDAAGATVTCVRGCLWVTVDGCPKDIQLSPGQSHLAEDARQVVVTGFEPSLARVFQPAMQTRPAQSRPLGKFLPSWRRRPAAA